MWSLGLFQGFPKGLCKLLPFQMDAIVGPLGMRDYPHFFIFLNWLWHPSFQTSYFLFLCLSVLNGTLFDQGLF